MVRRNLPDRPGQGLNWGQIREDYQARATDEELDGPFDEKGNLKSEKVRELNREATRTVQARQRETRAKKDPMSPQEAGKLGASRRKNIIREPQKNRIVLDYNAGTKISEIAKQEKLSDNSIRRVLKERGVYVPKRDLGFNGDRMR